ncbi:MAG: cbb3-type cytochrome oxidase assembly protein CcoS [Betaproteobacteria bacterium]|nr:cbb3-type cytochrome oxidase assembly protein CcoS [Betaproteobacteria bacterium]
MEILYILVPLSVIMAILLLAGLWWAVHKGQFEDVEDEGKRILEHDD